MRIKLSRSPLILIVVFLVLVIIAGLLVFNMPLSAHVGSDWAKIDLDVKLLRLNTIVYVYKDDSQIGTIKGNIVRLLTDPLTFYDEAGNRIAYAGDVYHLIAQDSHAIVVGEEVTAEMVGRVKLIGEAYDIYNTLGEKIAYAEFGFLNINGKITDKDGNVIAVYRAQPIMKDFDIYISPECTLDETTIIMICASYYSDHAADSKQSNSSN